MRHWARRQGLFRRGDLHQAHVEDLRGVYVPCVLYGARATSEYEAEIGENYQETQTYTVWVNGKLQTRTRTVTKTEWRTLAGRHTGLVVDVLVTASRGISNPELAALEPYDLRGLRRYQPQLVALLGLTLFPFVFPSVDEPGPGLKQMRLGEATVFVAKACSFVINLLALPLIYVFGRRKFCREVGLGAMALLAIAGPWLVPFWGG